MYYKTYKKMGPQKYPRTLSFLSRVALTVDIIILTGAIIVCYVCLKNSAPQNTIVSTQPLTPRPLRTPPMPNQLLSDSVLAPIIPDDVWNTATPTPMTAATLTAVPTNTPRPTATPLPPTATATKTFAPTFTVKPTDVPNHTPLLPTPTPELTTPNVISYELNISITAAAYAPDGKTFALGSTVRHLQIRSAQTGKLIKGFPKYSDAVTSLAYSPDGTILLTGSKDGTARLWSANGAPLNSFFSQSPVSKVLFTPQGDKIVICRTGEGASIEVIDTATKLSILQFSTKQGGQKLLQKSGVTDAAFFPGGKWILTGAPEGIVSWNIFTGKQYWGLTSIIHDWVGSYRDLVPCIVTGTVAVSPDGRYYSAAGACEKADISQLANRVIVWDTELNYSIYTPNFIFSPNSSVRAMAFSLPPPEYNFELIITGGADGVAQLWEINVNGGAVTLMRTFSLPSGNVIAVAFSPQRDQVLIASDTGHIKLFRL